MWQEPHADIKHGRSTADNMRALFSYQTSPIGRCWSPADLSKVVCAQVLDMLPVADSVTKLTSRCAFCDRAALFSLRTAADQAQEMVGGSDLYRPVCRRHYVQHSAVSSPAESARGNGSIEGLSAEA